MGHKDLLRALFFFANVVADGKLSSGHLGSRLSLLGFCLQGHTIRGEGDLDRPKPQTRKAQRGPRSARGAVFSLQHV